MARNLELKIKLSSHENIIKELKKNNANFVQTLNQEDTYFKTKSGLLKLREQNGNFELIKYLRDESGTNRWSDYQILYISGSNVEEYLSELFEIETTVKKVRDLYMLDNTRIHLDTVDHLGIFLELETLLIDGPEDAQKRFSNLVNLLDLKIDSQIRTSYRNLMLGL